MNVRIKQEAGVFTEVNSRQARNTTESFIVPVRLLLISSVQYGGQKRHSIQGKIGKHADKK